MAGTKQLRELAAKALVDPDFALRLRNDPLPVAAGYGIVLSEAQASSIKGVDIRELEKLREKTDLDLKPVAWADHW